MTRLARAWSALTPEQRLAAIAAVALLVTMFLPWYELQSLNRKTSAIDSRSISAFGDVSFVEAAVFLVAAGVLALVFARAENREFHMPGSDGTIVMIAGGWATLLIFYRVFSRPPGHGYPVGIQWGFFLAFVAAGALTFAGLRMRATSQPEPPLVRRPARRHPVLEEEVTELTTIRPRSAPVAARPAASPPATGRTESGPPASRSPHSTKPAQTRDRPRFPPSPSGQLSFEDTPAEHEDPPTQDAG